MTSGVSELAERFREALEAAVRTGEREPVYASCTRPGMGHTSAHAPRNRRPASELALGLTSESFEYDFDESDRADLGEGRAVCDARQVDRVRGSGDFAFEGNRPVQPTIQNAVIARYEMSIVG